ncbi:hypothetical protein GCM10011322_37880 [Salinarimonas ramus]|uniref:UDP-glucose 4-epimerase n=1 Tax=Salinarimonas ramus TaxID=690164 RepID=A0A917QEY0_9HYPH|nr:hypothetical protein GCM10011322_37880 [Salinarimonas ramus]
MASQAALGLRPALSIYGTDYATPDGTCLRDYIQVTDLADAHLAALRHLRAKGGRHTFNCGYGRGASVREVVETVKRISGIDFPVAEAPRRAGDPAALVADATRIRVTLAWEPRFADLDTIVAQALAWERRLGNSACAGTQASGGGPLS